MSSPGPCSKVRLYVGFQAQKKRPEIGALFPETMETLERLAAADYRMGIISNGTAGMKNCIEHLGQSIAYARMNGVVPPWSG